MAHTPRRRHFKPGTLAKQRNGRPASSVELRMLFNNSRILEKVASGELTERVIQEGHPASPLANEPECTLSQIIAYRDSQSKLVAEAHQYLRPDKTIGLSGLPDPKIVLHDGVLYYLDP